jgi:hypothetical protein
MQGSNPQGAVLHQALTTQAPQLAPQGIYWPGEVEEIARTWAVLPDALKAAVLGIVRSVGADGGTGLARGMRVVGEEGK